MTPVAKRVLWGSDWPVSMSIATAVGSRLRGDSLTTPHLSELETCWPQMRRASTGLRCNEARGGADDGRLPTRE
jgi:hypothetical protein